MVGIFNIQGSSWSRTRRQFIIHDQAPPTLSGVVRPADIPLFASSQVPDAEPTTDSHENQSASSSSHSTAQFAVYSNATGDMAVLGLQDELPVSLAGGLSPFINAYMTDMISQCCLIGVACLLAAHHGSAYYCHNCIYGVWQSLVAYNKHAGGTIGASLCSLRCDPIQQLDCNDLTHKFVHQVEQVR